MGLRQRPRYAAILVALASGQAFADAICKPRVPFGDSELCRPLEISRQAGKPTATEDLPLWARAGWTRASECAAGICAYSHPEIGGGSVLVSFEENADIVADFPVTSNFPDKPLPFKEKEFPGKGSGLVATRNIKKGETVMIRPAVMMVQEEAQKYLDIPERTSLYEMALDRLSRERDTQFKHQVGTDIADKIDRNAFQMTIHEHGEGSSVLGCFHDVAKMNHDCRPNIQYRIRGMTHTSVAVRDIEPGDELTISYIDASQPRSARQTELQQWGFNCSCSQCTLDPASSRASDQRLEKIKNLRSDLDNATSSTVKPETGADLVVLHIEERLDIYLSKAYTRAALNFALFAQEHEAREYAKMAVDALKREWGPLSGDIPGMEQLAAEPKAHWAWGKRLMRRSRPAPPL